jgi:hypothetical protein
MSPQLYRLLQLVYKSKHKNTGIWTKTKIVMKKRTREGEGKKTWEFISAEEEVQI